MEPEHDDFFAFAIEHLHEVQDVCDASGPTPGSSVTRPQPVSAARTTTSLIAPLAPLPGDGIVTSEFQLSKPAPRKPAVVLYNEFMSTDPNDKRVRCYVCGEKTINSGGTTKLKFYRYWCAKCKHMFNQERMPDKQGRYMVAPCKRGPDGGNVRKDYKCGKCGQPKKGHVCTELGKDATPKEKGSMRDPTAASTASNPHATAAALTAAAYGSQVDEDDVTACFDENDGNDAAGSFPMPTPTANEVGESVATALAAARTEIEKSMQRASGGVPSTPSAVTDSFSNLPTTDESQLVEKTERPTASPPQSFSSMTTTAPSATVSPTIVGQDVYRRLGLTRKKVCGDGSCMYYSILACLHVCEHANARAEKPPTAQDRGRDALLRVGGKEWLDANAADLNLKIEQSEIDEMLVMPKYPLSTTADFGTFGNMTYVMGVAGYLNLTIVCWNKTTLRNQAARQQVVEVTADGLKERALTNEAIIRLSETQPQKTIHIEWDGTNHYAGMVSATAATVDPMIRFRLENAPSVPLAPPPDESSSKTGRKSAAKSTTRTLPTGWTHVSNKYASIDSSLMHRFDPKTPLSKMFAMARENDCVAVAVFNDGESVVKMGLKYPSEVSEADLKEVADCEVDFYHYNSGAIPKKRTLEDTDITFACCDKVYVQTYTLLECSKCAGVSHLDCVVNALEPNPNKRKKCARKLLKEDGWMCASCA